MFFCNGQISQPLFLLVGVSFVMVLLDVRVITEVCVVVLDAADDTVLVFVLQNTNVKQEVTIIDGGNYECVESETDANTLWMNVVAHIDGAVESVVVDFYFVIPSQCLTQIGVHLCGVDVREGVAEVVDNSIKFIVLEAVVVSNTL